MLSVASTGLLCAAYMLTNPWHTTALLGTEVADIRGMWRGSIAGAEGARAVLGPLQGVSFGPRVDRAAAGEQPEALNEGRSRIRRPQSALLLAAPFVWMVGVLRKGRVAAVDFQLDTLG